MKSCLITFIIRQLQITATELLPQNYCDGYMKSSKISVAVDVDKIVPFTVLMGI